MIDFVTVYDPQGRVLWISRTDPDLNIPKENIVGKSIFEFATDSGPHDAFANALLKRVATTSALSTTHNGVHRTYRNTFHPVTIPGQAAVIGHSVAVPTVHLTPREIEIAVLIAKDLTTKQIAHRLLLSPSTVDSHRSAICTKLGGCGIAGITRFCVRHGLVNP